MAFTSVTLQYNGEICFSFWFLHPFVISTEGVAVVEKPAGKADSNTDLTIKVDGIRTYLRDLRSHSSRSFDCAALRSG